MDGNFQVYTTNDMALLRNLFCGARTMGTADSFDCTFRHKRPQMKM